MVQQLSTNTFCEAKWLVDPTAGQGSHTTIAGALTSASSGDTIFIRPGTYAENLTLKAGVSLTAYDCDDLTPAVIISGKATFSAAGTVTISGIRLQTNSDFFLVVSGSAASIVNLENCYLNSLNNIGISMTSSNAAATVNSFKCQGQLATTGIGHFASSSAGSLNYYYCTFSNPGASTTASTISAGAIGLVYTVFNAPITTSGTAAITALHLSIDTSATNTTSLTHGSSTGSKLVLYSYFASGSASAVSIGGSLIMSQCVINSTNTNAITGAGTLNFSALTFIGSSSTINTSTPALNPTSEGYFPAGVTFDNTNVLSNYATGSWTPTIIGTVAGTTTYTTQVGYYTRVGNMVTVQAFITITGATGTGTAVLGGLPFTVKNQASYSPTGSIYLGSSTWTWPVGTTHIVVNGVSNSITANIGCNGTANGGSNLQMTNGIASFLYTLTYQI